MFQQYTFLFVVLCGVFVVHGVYYDSFKGTPISDEEYVRHVKNNSTFWCINNITKCDPHEWRRLDGSCNNLREPSRGAAHTPFYRILPPAFEQDGKEFAPRRSRTGKPLPLVRKVRTTLLAEGRLPDQVFTQLSTYFLVFITSDIASLQDTANYVLWTPVCCTSKGKDNPMCAPIDVPVDDPVHRFSGINCLNLTKPMTFQTQGCRKNDTVPDRITSATPMFDLSIVYGNEGKTKRIFEGGSLKFEEDENGIIWPPSEKVNRGICSGNQGPLETRCHDTSSDEQNTLLPINLVSIWFWRLHNVIAEKLAELNPCWDDEKLFFTARDINIAIENQILYFELLPKMMGYDNLVHDGVISQISDIGFRDIYDESYLPQISMEFPMALRWLHNSVEGMVKMYLGNGTLVKEVSTVDVILRTGYLAVDNNIAHITQGSFRQASGKIDDHMIDPNLAERPLGKLQRAQDLGANDLAKNRLTFLQPYTKYLEHCFGKHVKSFEDLEDFFEPEVLEKLAEIYEHVEDIDLLAGMWTEGSIKGGRVPHTFYCIVVDQLIHTMKSDRHWYERPNRPHAFTTEQLQQIRQTSIASVLCTVGDTVTHIQPQAFRRIGPGNELISCQNIPMVDFNAWREDS